MMNPSKLLYLLESMMERTNPCRRAKNRSVKLPPFVETKKLNQENLTGFLTKSFRRGRYHINTLNGVRQTSYIPTAPMSVIPSNDEIENKSVKKTLTIPKWLDDLATDHNINFSQVLQEALNNWELPTSDPEAGRFFVEKNLRQ